MTVLYLCEKPSQARALASALGATIQESGAFVGNGVAVTFVYGHSQELAAPDDYIGNSAWSMGDLPILPDNWLWKVSDKHREQFDNVGKWLAKSSSAVIATDPDEEGEVIGRQLLAAHGFNKTTLRLWVSALDQNSLSKSLQNLLPLSATEPHYRAGLIRRKLDWLFGINLSRAYSIRYGRTSNVGRVKTRLLSELVKQELLIEQHKPSVFDKAHVSINGYQFEWDQVSDLAPAFASTGTCISSVEEMVSVAPPLPFSLSDLLIMANEMYGVGLASGYAAVQILYEAGVISYPRTSSRSLPDSGGFAVHHAIVTTNDYCPKWAGPDEQAIFNLVRSNGVHQTLGAARVSQVTSVFDFGGHQFSNVTRTVKEDEAGWLLCAPAELDRLLNSVMPSFAVGQKVNGSPTIERCERVAPRRYTEATLLRMMMENGLGTEATRVEAISSLLRDRVASFDEFGIVPSDAGRSLNAGIPDSVVKDMSNMVKIYVEQVRNYGGDGSTQLLAATKWLAHLIHGQPETAC